MESWRCENEASALLMCVRGEKKQIAKLVFYLNS